MRPAVAREAHRAQHGRPPLDHLGPLDGPPVVERVEARAQGPAVDHALRKGPEVARRRARHRLVQERATLVEPALVHEAEALEDEAQRLDVRVTGPPSDAEGSPRMLQPGFELAGAKLIEGHEGQHQSVLRPDGRFAGVAVCLGRQQSPRRRHPARDHGRTAA